MLGAGLFTGQRFELIGGDLIDKRGQKPPHSFAGSTIADWLTGLFRGRVRAQHPVEVSLPDRTLTGVTPLIVIACQNPRKNSLFREPPARGFLDRGVYSLGSGFTLAFPRMTSKHFRCNSRRCGTMPEKENGSSLSR